MENNKHNWTNNYLRSSPGRQQTQYPPRTLNQNPNNFSGTTQPPPAGQFNATPSINPSHFDHNAVSPQTTGFLRQGRAYSQQMTTSNGTWTYRSHGPYSSPSVTHTSEGLNAGFIRNARTPESPGGKRYRIHGEDLLDETLLYMTKGGRGEQRDGEESHNSDRETERNKKGPTRVPVDESLTPPAWLQIKQDKHRAQAFQQPYPSSSQQWFTEDRLTQEAGNLVIKPQPEGGDKGIPATKAEEQAFAKQVYDAIVDFRHFYGSTSGVVARLLEGRFPTWYIMKRSMDVVVTLKLYHTEGLVATDFANPNVVSSTGARIKDSEQDDTCEERRQNILHALTFCKSVACDVLQDKESLASALILAPKRRIRAKLAYKESNDGRAETNRVIKRARDDMRARRARQEVTS